MDADTKLSQHRDVLFELVRYKQSGRANQKTVGRPFFWFRFLWQFKENELAKGETPPIEIQGKLVYFKCSINLRMSPVVAPSLLMCEFELLLVASVSLFVKLIQSVTKRTYQRFRLVGDITFLSTAREK